MYRVDPQIFQKMSDKFRVDYPNCPNQMDFKENVSREVFDVFINACQLKNFEIQPEYALDVLDVSRTWEVPSLEKYTKQYCRDHGIKFRPREDYIGILLNKIDNNCEDVQDLQNVANVINDVFDDDRLPEVAAEDLFRIIVLAEKVELDMDKLIEFVMKLYEINPEAAVLLTLRIDFDKLTEEQLNVIFHCSEMHNISIGFFVAFSLSATRNKTKGDLVETQRKHIEAMNLFDREMDNEHRKMVMKLDTEHRNEMQKLNNILLEQDKKINELTDILHSMAEALDTGPLSPRGIGDENLRRIKEETVERVSGIRDRIEGEVQNALKECESIFENSVAKVEDDWEKECADPLFVEKETERVLSLAEERGNMFDKLLEGIENIIHRTKCGLAAKVVKDKIRISKGVRENVNIASKFELFDVNKDLWNLDKRDIKVQYSNIKDIEKLIDEICPIRAGTVGRALRPEYY